MPITLDGTLGVTTPMYNGSITANAVTPSVNMKNRIINGAMVIDQRNAGASVSIQNSTGYTLDRWTAVANQNSKYSVQQNAGSVTTPAGFRNYLGVTSSSAFSSAAGDYFFLAQYIEGFNTADLAWGTANAQTVTISFWVRSSLTGIFGGVVGNSAQDRSYPFTYTINSANTWEQKSVTIAGDTTGTWVGATNGIGIAIRFDLGSGSTFKTTAGAWTAGNFIGASGTSTYPTSTSSGTLQFTGVQLEVGSTATSFDYRPYGTELALCQRYYYQFMGQAANNNFIGIASGVLLTTTTARTTLIHKVPMRASPTITPSASGTLQVQAGASSSTVTGLTAYSGTESALLDFGINTAGTAGQGAAIFSVANTQFLTVSAEL